MSSEFMLSPVLDMVICHKGPANNSLRISYIFNHSCNNSTHRGCARLMGESEDAYKQLRFWKSIPHRTSPASTKDGRVSKSFFVLQIILAMNFTSVMEALPAICLTSPALPVQPGMDISAL